MKYIPKKIKTIEAVQYLGIVEGKPQFSEEVAWIQLLLNADYLHVYLGELYITREDSRPDIKVSVNSYIVVDGDPNFDSFEELMDDYKIYNWCKEQLNVGYNCIMNNIVEEDK